MKINGKEAGVMREFLKKYQYVIIAVFFIVVVLIVAFFSTGYLDDSPMQSENSAVESLLQDDMTEWNPLEDTESVNTTVSEYISSNIVEDSLSESSSKTIVDTSSALQHASSAEPSRHTEVQWEVPPQDGLENAGQVSNNQQLACVFSISCETIQNNMDKLKPNKVGIIPPDGWIQRPIMVAFQEGESVFDVLKRVCQENGIHLEFSYTPIYNSAYIEGIYNLYEFDCGSLSGWMYNVNGVFPNYSCSSYSLKNGDVVALQYTCSYGDDIGGRNVLD